MKHAASFEIYHYWSRMCAGRRAPERTDINPVEIRRVLPDLFILKDEDECLKFGLTGTRLYDLFHTELTGKPFTSIWSAAVVKHGLGLARDVMLHHMPVAIQVLGETVSGFETVDLEMLLLPLAAEASSPRRLLGCISTGAPRSEFAAVLSPLVIVHSVVLRPATTRSGGPAQPLYQNRKLCE